MSRFLIQLVGFVHYLRKLGLRPGTSEVIDALRSLNNVDLENRDQVKSAFSATLVKDKRGYGVFSTAFDVFFSNRDQIDSEAAGECECDELEVQGRALDVDGELKQLYEGLEPGEKERLHEFLTKTSDGLKVSPRHDNLVARLVEGHLRRLQDREPVSPVMVEATGDEETDRLLQEATDRLKDSDVALMHRDLGSLTSEDRSKMELLVQRLARRLASGLSRRYKWSVRRKRVDFRRTVRKSIGYGGVCTDLMFRSRHERKPKIVVIADVSGSMARYSEFVLLFVYGLVRAVMGVELFAFTEDLVHLTPRVRGSVDEVESALGEAAEVHGKTTNFARALGTFLDDHSDLLSARTVVLVVSDTKTQQLDESVERLAEVFRRCRKIVWLNTVPRQRWGRLRGVEKLRRYCVMQECYTVGHLDSVLRDALV